MINQTKTLLCYNQANFKRVKTIISRALKSNKFYQKKFKAAGITKTINSWEDFYKLPITTKEELVQDQIKHPPFGTNYSCIESEIIHFTTTSRSSTGHKLTVSYTKRDIKGEIEQWEFFEINNLKTKQADINLVLDEPEQLYFHVVLSITDSIVYGASCREDDVLYQNQLPKTVIDDFIIYYATEAYNLNMGSDFIFNKPKLSIIN